MTTALSPILDDIMTALDRIERVIDTIPLVREVRVEVPVPVEVRVEVPVPAAPVEDAHADALRAENELLRTRQSQMAQRVTLAIERLEKMAGVKPAPATASSMERLIQ